MPIKKKQSKSKQKEEVLEASSMQDGNSNYYIGGWSHYQEINDVSTIANTVINRHIGDDRRVKPLPRTTVLLIPPLRVSSSEKTTNAIACKPKLESRMYTSSEQEETNFTHALPQRAPTQITLNNSIKCQSEEEENGVEECVVTVCDKMSIEGVSRRAMTDAAMHFRSLLQSESYHLSSTVNSPVRSNTADNNNNKNNDGDAAVIEDSKDEETRNNDNKNTSISNKNVKTTDESLFALQPEAADKLVNHYSNDDDEEEINELQEINRANVNCGAHFSAQDVRITCSHKLIISGAAPRIVIDPALPSPPPEVKDYINFTQGANNNTTITTDTSDAARRPRSNNSTRTSTTQNSSANANSKRPSSKRRSKVKQTQEELEEIERKRAEAVALFEKQTNEAIAKARLEEALACTFAHPDQWPSVVFTNVTFSSPVVVQGAHVVFQHCRFVSSNSSIEKMESALPQLTISQYCHVRCNHCTFELPIKCGVYAYPTSQLDLQKCLFTGITHLDLMRNAFTINASNTEVNVERWNDRINSIKTLKINTSHKSLQQKNDMENFQVADSVQQTKAADDDDDDNSMANAYDGDGVANAAHSNYNEINRIGKEIHAINTATSEENTNNELSLSPSLTKQYHLAQQTRLSAVGVHADQARVSVIKCQFLFLEFGCVFNGCHPSHAHVHSSQKTQTKNAKHLPSESMINVLHSHFYHLYGSGMVLQHNTRYVKVEHNTFASCAYYAIDVQRNVHDNNVTGNTFSHNALLRIRNGGKARVLQNKMESLLVDDNKYENLCLKIWRELPIHGKNLTL